MPALWRDREAVMRRAAKIDGTQTEIVAALRQVGCKVLSLAACGKGVPDLLVLPPFVIYHDRDWCEDCDRPVLPYLLEVKNLSGRGNKLTPDQVKFHAEWPVTVVTSVEEALAAVGISGDGH